MAKKKTAETANLKASPVLRALDGGGGQDPTKTKSYCVRDDWKDRDIVNYVGFKSVDGEVQDLTVNGEPAGGGGFSSAAVSVANNGQADVRINIAAVDLDNNMIIPEIYADAGTDNDHQCIVTSQGYIDTISQQIQIGGVTATGDITVNTVATGVYQITINGAGGIIID